MQNTIHNVIVDVYKRQVEKQGGFTSLPLEAGNMGLNDRRDFIAMFKKSIEDLNRLGRFDLSLIHI